MISKTLMPVHNKMVLDVLKHVEHHFLYIQGEYDMHKHEKVCIAYFAPDNLLYSNIGWDYDSINNKLCMIGNKGYKTV